jgi:ribosomal protein L37AE/L43A
MGVGLILMNSLMRLGLGRCRKCDQTVMMQRHCGGAWTCLECGSFGVPWPYAEIRD